MEIEYEKYSDSLPKEGQGNGKQLLNKLSSLNKKKAQTNLNSFLKLDKMEEEKPKSQVQPSISCFLKPKPPVPFTPVDIVREPRIIVKPKRGRPPKNKEISEGVTDSKLNRRIEEKSEFLNVEAENAKESDEKRGKYAKISYKTRKEIIEDYIQFKSNRPHDQDGKPLSFNEFCRQLEVKLNSTCKFNSIKRICLSYDKSPSILTELEVLCSNTKKIYSRGHIKRREPALTYDKNLDLELYDWILCSIELGAAITREDVKNKAINLITPTNPNFKGSDMC